MNIKEKENKYSDFSNVNDMNNILIPEEFPEGSFGAPINAVDPVYGKSSKWEKGQQRDSAFIYPDRDRHDDLPRQTPGAHPLHNEQNPK